MVEVMNQAIKAELKQRGVVAVLELQNQEDAIPVIAALLSGGVSAIELALRTEAALPAVQIIHEKFPELLLGIGTVIMPGQAQKVKDLGASFAVSPGFNPTIVQEAINCGLPFAPGISTASELERAHAMGCTFFKLFPAVPLGGIPYFKSMSAPYNYLGLQFFPLGGITEENMADWGKLPNVIAIGGSWIASQALIKQKNYNEITRRAQKAVSLWKKSKENSHEA